METDTDSARAFAKSIDPIIYNFGQSGSNLVITNSLWYRDPQNGLLK